MQLLYRQRNALDIASFVAEVGTHLAIEARRLSQLYGDAVLCLIRNRQPESAPVHAAQREHQFELIGLF